MLHIYDISSLKVNDLTFILLTWRKWLAPNNASRQQMGLNSGFKGLIYICLVHHSSVSIILSHTTTRAFRHSSYSFPINKNHSILLTLLLHLQYYRLLDLSLVKIQFAKGQVQRTLYTQLYCTMRIYIYIQGVRKVAVHLGCSVS